MINFLFLLAIFGPNIYFSFLASFGLSYKGLENGGISYWGYLITLLVVTSTYFIVKILIKKSISFKELLCVISFIIFTILITFYNLIFTKGIRVYSVNQLLFFIIFALPAILAGWYYSNDREKSVFLFKNIEVVMLFFTIGIFVSTFMIIITGNKFDSIGGASYQSASYISAFAFGINLFFLLGYSKVERYRIFKSSIYKYIQIILLFIQLISIILGGGRGAFILFIVYIIICTSIVILHKNPKKIAKYILITIFFLIILKFSINIFETNTLFIDNGIRRILAYISVDGIDWGGTSGRDQVYSGVVQVILKNPLVGIGFFNYPYPHNLFLEILVSSGIIGFFVFIILEILFFKKFIEVIRIDKQYLLLVIIFTYPLIMLMFSGSVFSSAEWWFVTSYIYFFNPLKEKTL